MEEKQLLQLLVKECNSFSEILRRLGKAISGTSVKLLKQKLEDYGISYLFVSESLREKETRPLEEILVEDSSYKPQDLKKRLIRAGLKEDVCEICGQINTWNNKPLVLQLDHINGNHYDNRLENLRIVCPNCHSQTDTFANKKNKKVNYCIDCGKEISYKSTRCQSCASKKANKYKVPLEDRPNKEELLELIKTKSFTEVGRMYGVQDNAIRKWCKNYGIPHTKKELKILYSR